MHTPVRQTAAHPSGKPGRSSRGARGVPSRPDPPLLWLRPHVGNATLRRLVQRNLTVSRPSDSSERQAGLLADRMVPAPGPAHAGRDSAAPPRVTPLPDRAAAPAEGAGEHPVPWEIGAAQPLDPALRTSFESRVGESLAQVRVHTDAAAARSAQSLDARAYTLGQDIVFGPGRYQPRSPEGRRLVAHELAHTIQQRGRRPDVIQRDTPKTAPTTIGAREVFPFPVGARVVLNRLLSDDWFHILQAVRPDVAASLGAIERRVVVVQTASDDLFEAAFDGSLTLPAQGDQPAVTLSDVRLSLRRQSDGTFDFELSGRTSPDAAPTELFAQRGLSAAREDGAVVLSSATGPQLRVSPGGSEGQVRIEAYTTPYLAQLPDLARRLAPERLELLQLSRLPDVREGGAEEQRAVETVASSVAGGRRTRRQRLTVGGGIQAGAAVDPLLTAAWQINFRPIEVAGPFFQVPLELQVQYVPKESILGEVSTGVETSFSQIEVPVNVRVNLGWAGGQIYGEEPPTGGERPLIGAFGPVLGGGGGLELGAFRMDLRYEHLFNLWNASPNLNSVYLKLGGAF